MSTGRTLYVNAYIEDPDQLILTVYNHKRSFWSLPGCEIRPNETPESACARTLMNECDVGAKKLMPLYEDDAGTDGHVIVFQCAIDGFPRQTREEAPLRAMTHEEYVAQTPFPKFYERLFTIARERKLYCIMVQRHNPITGKWKYEDTYAHAFTREEALRGFLVGEGQEVQAGRMRVVDCGLVINYKVTDTKGVKLAV